MEDQFVIQMYYFLIRSLGIVLLLYLHKYEILMAT